MSAIDNASEQQRDEGRKARLVMRGIRKRFGATVALDGVDFEVRGGEVLALVGENGAGKSTLMKVLAGVIQPDSGDMQLRGMTYRPGNPQAARRAGVAMIYQELSLAPHLSVAENILLGLEPSRLGVVKWQQLRAKAREALAALEHPEIDPKAIVSSLPIASQQLVEIARALVIAEASAEPGQGVIVLDEPTSSLGREDVQRLFRVIESLRDAGHAIIYISHFIEEVQQIADRFTVLRDGKSVGGDDVEGASAQSIIEMMVGRSLDQMYPRSAHTPGEVVLSVKHLAGQPLPDDASFELKRGEVLGIAGLIGAGRSELLRTIFGLMPVRQGEVKVGAYVGSASPAKRYAQGVGLLSEDRKGEGLALSLSVGENLTMSRTHSLGWGPFVWPHKRRAVTRKWIDRLAVRCQGPDQPIGALSGGNQQKVAIGRLLHHDVDVLLLDEPTRGVDVGSKAQIYRLIDEAACAGKAVLVVSSYLPELLGVCDRAAVMHRGRLREARPIEGLAEQMLMAQATGVDTPA